MTMTMESTEAVISQSIGSKPDQTIEESDDESEPMHSDTDGLSTEPDSPVHNDHEDEVDRADEIIPDGDSNADLHALLAYSKSRLEKQAVQQLVSPPPLADEKPAEISDDDEIGDEDADDTIIKRTNSADEQLEIARAKMAEAEAKAAADDDEMEALREEARLRSAQSQGEANGEVEEHNENDPAYLLRLAETKVREAEEKARKDLEATGVNVIMPTVATKRRSEANSELWALLNYSKKRLETGATPQVGKKAAPARGDDVSVSSKGTKISVSSASKKSSASRSITSGSKAPVSVVGASDNSEKNEEALSKVEGEHVPVPDVTGDDASVEGSVSGDDEQSLRDESDEEGSDSDESEEDDEEEDELPSFLKDDEEEEVDPAEAKRLYEEAKFKAASILSVDENLTDVQMLQAMAIAVEAAKKGEDKFSTKRSLFRLNEAKLDDLKSFLDFSGTKRETATENNTTETNERERVGWGIGRGRLIKKLGAAFHDLKVRCDEIDERKQQERKGQLSNTDMFNVAFNDLKKQIDEYEKIVKGNLSREL